MPSKAVQEKHPVMAAEAAPYLAPSYLTRSALDTMGDWYRSEDPHPLVLRDFLLPELARSIGTALRSVPRWSPHSAIYEGKLKKTEFWDDDADAGRDVTITQLVVRDIHALLDEGVMDRTHQQALETFFVFSVLSNVLRDWIHAGTGLRLRRRTPMDIAAYRNSDGLGAHQDLVPGRVLAANFYLDEQYREEQNGRLGFRNGRGQEFHVPPLFNTLSLMPIREDCWHWVEPFTSDSVGRYTIALGLHLEES